MKQIITKQNIANLLDQAAFTAKATQQVSTKTAISLSDAYAIQATSLAKRYERGEKLTGYKLGFTSKAKMEQMGVHEIIWGRLTDKMEVEQNGKLIRKRFIHPRVEPEIAFLIGKRIDRPIDLAESRDYLDGIAAALEIIDSRYEHFKFSLEDVIADNCSSAAYVLGDWHSARTPINDLAISLQINDKVIQKGNSKAILGNPLQSLIELTKLLSRQGIVIEPGMVILAGAATSAEYIHPSDAIEGHFENLGMVKLNVA